MKKINPKGLPVAIVVKGDQDYISLTDIARFKNPETTGLVISHWLSNRGTIEFLGIWEQIHNLKFNVTEFRNIRNSSGSNGYVLTVKQWVENTGAIGLISAKEANIIYASEADILNKALYGLTAKEWRARNPELTGNIRDYADVTQLVVLANLESINAELIKRGLSQSERLVQLNQIAISQMRSLVGNPSIKKLI